jgi:hypothetical protein
MRIFAAVALATSVLASSAFAAGTEVRAPLAPGKPASVKKAQMEGDNTMMIVAGVAIVAGGIALVASEGNDTVVVAPTSSTTTGTP